MNRYEVLSAEPDRGFRVRDFFSSSECWVHEKAAAASMAPGSLLFGSLADDDSAKQVGFDAATVKRLREQLGLV